MTVRRNIIVSPGISQIFSFKLKQLGFAEADEASRLTKELMERDRRGSQTQPPLIDGENLDEQVNRAIVTIGQALVRTLKTPSAVDRGVEGPFGAELTTLLGWESQLKNEKQYQGLDQPLLQGSRVVILSSHSWSGLLAAQILKRVLTEHWQMVVPKDCFWLVDGLCQRPLNPTAAMENFARLVVKSLRGYEKGDSGQWENTFLMTSGFKSVIPCMTIFSLLYGVEMIYTFEESDAVQRLHPRQDLNQPESRAFWEGTWKGMRKQHWADESANAYLRAALVGRLANINKSFSGKG